MTDYTDEALLALYREWSEEYYAASFLTCSPQHAQMFVDWLSRREQEPTERAWYETEMLAMVRPLLPVPEEVAND